MLKRQQIRGWDFIRVQTSVLQIVILGLILGLEFPQSPWQYVVFISLIITLGFQLYVVFPYTSFFPRKHKKPDNAEMLNKISLLSANVLQTNREYHKLIEQVNLHQPDLLLVMETDKGWENGLKELEDWKKEFGTS